LRAGSLPEPDWLEKTPCDKKLADCITAILYVPGVPLMIGKVKPFSRGGKPCPTLPLPCDQVMLFAVAMKPLHQPEPFKSF
jgi:hypothetical protein